MRGQLGLLASGRVVGRVKWQQSKRSLATSSSDSDSYQYLQRSKLPTMYFQKSLPRLPIPLTEKTCQRFLEAVQPITSAAEFAETQQVVGEFKSIDGPELNAMLKLKDEANKHTSYISEPW